MNLICFMIGFAIGTLFMFCLAIWLHSGDGAHE